MRNHSTRGWRALESIFVVPLWGVFVCVREGQSGFWECSQPWVMWGGDLVSVHTSIRTISFSVFIVFNSEIASNENTTAKTFYIKDIYIYIQYTTYPTLSPPTGSGSRPRSGQCCFLHFLSQTWLFRFFSFHYISCFICYRCRGLCVGQHFLLLRAVWCQHRILQTQLFFPNNIYSIFSLKTPWPAEVTHGGSVFMCDNRNNSPASCWAHCFEEVVPAKWLSGATYYRSHHLLHPAGPPSWRPAPTSLLLLHLSKGTKREREGYESGTWSKQATQKESWKDFLEAEKK